MNLFKLLTKVYLLRWIKDLVVSMIIACLMAIFFGFFSDTWFVTNAFLAFFIPTAIFSARRCWLDRRVMQPFDDVVSIFNPKASAAQKKRGIEKLREAAEEERQSLAEHDDDCNDEDDNEQEEDAKPSAEVLKEAKAKAELVLKLLIKCQLVKHDQTLLKRTKQYFEDHEVRVYGLEVNSFIHEILENKFFQWGREVLGESDNTEYYTHILSCISNKRLTLELISLDDSDEENHQIIMTVNVNGNEEKWRFTQYDYEPADNVIIHLSLLLKEHTDYQLHWEGMEEWTEAIALPNALIKILKEKTDFESGDYL